MFSFSLSIPYFYFYFFFLKELKGNFSESKRESTGVFFAWNIWGERENNNSLHFRREESPGNPETAEQSYRAFFTSVVHSKPSLFSISYFCIILHFSCVFLMAGILSNVSKGK